MAIIHKWSSLAVILIGAAIFSALYGCAGVSKKEYDQQRHYVAEKVPPGMPVAEAIQAFAKDGYTCKDRGDIAECDRSEDGLLNFCRYRVLMHVDTERKIVTKSSPDILCAKKYP